MKEGAILSNRQRHEEEAEVELEETKMDKFYEIIRNYRRARDSSRKQLMDDRQPSSAYKAAVVEVEGEDEGEKRKNKRMRVEQPAAVNTNGGSGYDGGGDHGGWVPSFKWEDFMENNNQLVQLRRTPLISGSINCRKMILMAKNDKINHGNLDGGGGGDRSNSPKEIDGEGGGDGGLVDLNLSL